MSDPGFMQEQERRAAASSSIPIALRTPLAKFVVISALYALDVAISLCFFFTEAAHVTHILFNTTIHWFVFAAALTTTAVGVSLPYVGHKVSWLLPFYQIAHGVVALVTAIMSSIAIVIMWNHASSCDTCGVAALFALGDLVCLIPLLPCAWYTVRRAPLFVVRMGAVQPSSSEYRP